MRTDLCPGLPQPPDSRHRADGDSCTAETERRGLAPLSLTEAQPKRQKIAGCRGKPSMARSLLWRALCFWIRNQWVVVA